MVDGLCLLPFVKGCSHGCRFDYRIEGKGKMLSLGTYPDTSLAVTRPPVVQLPKQAVAVLRGLQPLTGGG